MTSRTMRRVPGGRTRHLLVCLAFLGASACAGEEAANTPDEPVTPARTNTPSETVVEQPHALALDQDGSGASEDDYKYLTTPAPQKRSAAIDQDLTAIKQPAKTQASPLTKKIEQ